MASNKSVSVVGACHDFLDILPKEKYDKRVLGMKFSLGKPEPLFIADDFYDENRRSCRLFLLYRKLLRNVPIKQKSSARMRPDA